MCNNTYNGRGSRLSQEKNDCTVIALAYCWDIDYEVAHGWAAKMGREKGKGLSTLDIFGLGWDKRTKQMYGRMVSRHGKPGQSVDMFAKKHPKGTFYCRVSGHVFALIDGKIYNQGSLSQHILEYFYISKPVNNQKITQDEKL